MSEIEELEKNLKDMKENMAVLQKQLSAKKDCAKKNDRYNNDEEFREWRKQKTKEYYYNVVKPKIEKAKVNYEKEVEQILEKPVKKNKTVKM